MASCDGEWASGSHAATWLYDRGGAVVALYLSADLSSEMTTMVRL